MGCGLVEVSPGLNDCPRASPADDQSTAIATQRTSHRDRLLHVAPSLNRVTDLGVKLAVLSGDARFSDKWNNSPEAVDVRASEGKSESKTLTTVWVQFSHHAALQ